MVDGRAARWVGHRDRRRAELVAAAVAAIDALGPHATVDQIAVQAGTTRQAVYRQFTDRSDLDRAVAEHAATMLVEHLTPHLVVDEGVEVGVRRALAAYLDFVQTHLALYRFVRSHDAESAPGAVRRVKSTVTEVVSAVARAVQGDRAGAFPVQAETVAVALVGMSDAVIAAWLDEPERTSPQALLDQLVLLCLGVVAAATDTASP